MKAKWLNLHSVGPIRRPTIASWRLLATTRVPLGTEAFSRDCWCAPVGCEENGLGFWGGPVSPFHPLERIRRVTSFAIDLGGPIGILKSSRPEVDALGAWFEAEYPKLLRFAYFLTSDRDDAEDLVQEAFVRINRAGGRTSEPEFAGYARRTLLNLSRSGIRRRVRESGLLARIRPFGVSPGPNGEEREDLRKALLALPVVQRACLAMRFYEDRKEREIAAALDMSLSAVKKQIERGLKALRPRLDDRSAQ